jgi:hypothetical protein
MRMKFSCGRRNRQSGDGRFRARRDIGCPAGFLDDALHLNQFFFRHASEPPYHVNLGGAPTNSGFVQLISNQLMFERRGLCLDEVADIRDDVEAARVRPDLTDAF